MIAFNFNIHFQDEPSLDDGIFDTQRRTILVQENQHCFNKNRFPIVSDYIILSDRKAKYYATSVYDDNQKDVVWGIEIENVLFFTWISNEQNVYYQKLTNYEPKLLEFWILHTILPIVFTLEKRYAILHVGSIEIEGNPIVFTAPSFGGKSTLVDYFIRQGHTLIADDTIGVYKQDGFYNIVPSYPFHRPYRRAETLGCKIKNVSNIPKKFQVIYKLDRCKAREEIKFRELNGIEKFKVFHFSTFINFNYLQKIHFELASDISKSVMVYAISIPWDLNRLAEVYTAIVQHEKYILKLKNRK